MRIDSGADVFGINTVKILAACIQDCSCYSCLLKIENEKLFQEVFFLSKEEEI